MKREPPARMKNGLLQDYMEQYLEEMEAGDACAMFLVQFDNTEETWTALGRKEKEKAVQYAEQVLASLFRARDIVGQTEEGSFLILLSGAITEEAVYEKARLLCEKLQFTAEKDPSVYITVCTGVCLAERDEKRLTVDGLYERAGKALEKARENGRGSFYVWSELPEDRLIREVGRPANSIQLHTLLKYMDGGVCLIEAGPQIRVLYASPGFYQMTGRREGDLRLPCALGEIGIHPDYEADYE